MNDVLYQKINKFCHVVAKIKEKIASFNVVNDYKKINKLKKIIKPFLTIYENFHKYKKIDKNLILHKNEYELCEKEFKLLFEEQIKELEIEKNKLSNDIENNFLLVNNNVCKELILEIRGAAGGREANIFAYNLTQMYMKYCDKNNLKWRIINFDLLSSNEMIFGQFMISGKNVYSMFKYEAGIHRVQRVPSTEAKGRVHTSTAQVAVIPKYKNITVTIDEGDLRIDRYRASSAGGQHVNKTDSAIRITHLPTKIVVTSQDGRSQHDNKKIAMNLLLLKLQKLSNDEQYSKINKIRNSAIKEGKRAEKIRTYNFPQNRLTDHRINFSIQQLDNIMEGNLQKINKLVIVNLIIEDFYEQNPTFDT